MTAGEAIRERAARVRDRIEEAVRRSGRKGEDIRLVAVGKTQPVESIGEALEAGLTAFGEHYVAGEQAKAGLAPEELPVLIEAAPGLPGIRLRGLMAIPPWTEDPEESRPYFVRLRERLAECVSRGGAGLGGAGGLAGG